jgi:hypothetical protein
MYLKAFSKKEATVEQRHALEKLVTKQVNLNQRHLLSKTFIRKAFEP